MDKIYSRRRIKIQKVEGLRFREKSLKTKFIETSIVMLVAILTAFFIIRALNPMFNTMCLTKARGMATDILNIESSKVLKDVDYEELVSIARNKNRSNYNVKGKYSQD